MDDIPIGRVTHILAKYNRSICACGSDLTGDLARKGEEPSCWECRIIYKNSGSGRDRNRGRHGR